ncbi:regulatory protein RecX [Pontixanthobacter aquaemixtae]|uniref:regulatory protein RecX n=1 Tax=Pontixanthobacter aquaemixtae TaxID=1958940 RepID=UPI002E25220B
MKRPKKPLDSARLQELALAYVARFSTSTSKLETYLKRKLRERGWEGEAEPDVAAISARYVELGYIDDAAYARAKAGGLLSRGYGARRVSQALYAAGIDENIREDVAPDELKMRLAVQKMAQKRRFGPYYVPKDGQSLDRDRREKQIAALLRAGHGFDIVGKVMNARSAEAVDDWVNEARDEEY